MKKWVFVLVVAALLVSACVSSGPAPEVVREEYPGCEKMGPGMYICETETVSGTECVIFYSVYGLALSCNWEEAE